MRKGFLGSLATLFTAVAVAPAQMMPVYPVYGAPTYYPMPPQMAPVAYPRSPVIQAASAADTTSTAPATSMPAGPTDGSCATGSCYAPVYTPAYEPAYEYPAAGGEGGGGCCKDGQDCNGPRECWWINGEYLLWRIKHGPLPVPLATTTTPGGTGALGAPGTSVILGNSTLDYHQFSGAKLSGGFWFDPDQRCLGVEASAFDLPRRSIRDGVNSSGLGSPPILIPFLDTTTLPATEAAFPLATPGVSAGGVTLISSSRLWGGDVNLIGNLLTGSNVRWIVLTGFRYLDLSEQLDIFDHTQTPVLVPTTTVDITDSFLTRSQFFGFQFGTRLDYYFWRFYVELEEKLALGITRETVNIAGFTTLTTAGATTTFPGGFFAEPGDSGLFRRNELAGVSETEVKLGMTICRGLNAFAGYDFLYWTNVARPGSQINRSVDTTQVPALNGFVIPAFTPTPHVQVSHTSFWAQGVDLGLEFKY